MRDIDIGLGMRINHTINVQKVVIGFKLTNECCCNRLTGQTVYNRSGVFQVVYRKIETTYNIMTKDVIVTNRTSFFCDLYYLAIKKTCPTSGPLPVASARCSVSSSVIAPRVLVKSRSPPVASDGQYLGLICHLEIPNFQKKLVVQLLFTVVGCNSRRFILFMFIPIIVPPLRPDQKGPG